jgi:hypothetical protein
VSSRSSWPPAGYTLKNIELGFTGCGVLEYLYLEEVTCSGKAQSYGFYYAWIYGSKTEPVLLICVGINKHRFNLYIPDLYFNSCNRDIAVEN